MSLPRRPGRPRRRRAPARAGAVALALVLLPSCTTDSPAGPAQAARPSATTQLVGAAAATSPASELQAALTALLVERSYAVAALTSAVAEAQGDLADPAVLAAHDALAAGSAAVGDVLAARYATAREPLRTSLARIDALLLESAAALAAPDGRLRRRALDEVTAAHAELAQVVRRVVPQLDAQEVAQRLSSDLDAQREARDPVRLRLVAAGAARTADLLAAGVALDRGLGDTRTPAVRLRAELTGLLTEHVALAALLARSTAEPAAAALALDANARALTDVVGASYPAARTPFARSWAGHLDRLERQAADPADPRVVTAYAAELARILERHVDGLPARTSRAELEPVLSLLVRAMDAAGTPEGPAALRRASQAVLPASALLATAVAEDLRLG